MCVPLSERALTGLRMVLQWNRNGLSADELVEQYNEEFPQYNADLNWREMNHASINDLLDTAPNGFFSKKYFPRGFVRYFPGQANSNCEKTQTDLSKSDCNVDLATVDDQFEPLALEELLKSSNKLVVHVAEIYTPNHFYLNPALDNTLDDLMDMLHQFLTDEKKDQLKVVQITEGLPVIVHHSDGAYYRAKIVELSDPVGVFLVDYGTDYDVQKDRIFRIPIQFMTLPVQAFKATLDNVKPFYSEEWTTNNAAFWLMDHTSSKVTATITNHNSECVTVNLQSNAEVQSINEAIVAANLASYCNEPPRMETHFENLSASFKMPSINNGHQSNGAFSPVLTTESVDTFSPDELMQIRKDLQSPLQVAQLQGNAVSLLNDCLNSFITQRKTCLAALSNNIDRENIFKHVEILYPIIRELKTIRNEFVNKL